ncbi:MAG: hypothetical protein GY763_04700, partial [Gammaproteobacteria bacterium]|nr:hypothetical protein [Gammaproteobacteria bacterium]
TNPPLFAGIEEAEYSSASSVKLEWRLGAGVLTASYDIFLGFSGEIDYAVPYATVAGDLTSHTLTGLGDQHEYTFAMRACTASEVCDTNILTITPTRSGDNIDFGAPKSTGISSLSLNDGTFYITAPWKHEDGRTTKRKLYRASGVTPGVYTVVSTISVSDSTDVAETIIYNGTLTENTTYHFMVHDSDGISESANTKSMSVSTGDLVAPTFSGLDALSIGTTGSEDSSLTLEFTTTTHQPADSDGASSYRILVSNSVTTACDSGEVMGAIPA